MAIADQIASAAFSDLLPGTYTVVVNEYNNTTLIASGNNTAEVKQGEKNTVDIVLTLIPEILEISVDLSKITAPKINTTIPNSLESADLFVFPPFKESMEIEEGYLKDELKQEHFDFKKRAWEFIDTKDFRFVKIREEFLQGLKIGDMIQLNIGNQRFPLIVKSYNPRGLNNFSFVAEGKDNSGYLSVTCESGYFGVSIHINQDLYGITSLSDNIHALILKDQTKMSEDNDIYLDPATEA